MKNSWQTKRLSDVCEVFADGDWVESKDQSSDGIRLIQTGNVGEGVFKDRAEKARYISQATFNRLRCTEIFEGDCLISRLPDPVGRSCILPATDERMITAVDCTIVRFKSSELLPEFFNLYAQSDAYIGTVAKECTGTTRSRISRSKLALIPIPVPPLAEQRRIVETIEKAFASIATAQANAEKNHRNARALFESHLQSVFTQRGKGWVERRLGDVVTRLTNGYVGPTRNIYQDRGVPYLLARHVKNNRLIFDGKTFIAEEFNRKNKKSMLTAGDVLLVQSGHIGHSAVVTAEHEGHNCHAMIVITPVKGAFIGPFLSLYFNSPEMKRKFQEIRSGSTVPHLTCGEVKELRIAIPDLATQERLVEHSLELEHESQRLSAIYERKVAKLDALKQSLLHQAFAAGLAKAIVRSVVSPFPVTIRNVSTTDLHAGILAIAYWAHKNEGQLAHFAHVKAEKIAHMAESFVGIDLGRAPVKDAAGPNDFPQLTRVEHRARKAGYFDFQQTDGGAYRVTTLGQFDKLVASTRQKLGSHLKDVEGLIDLMVPMTTQQAEIAATVFAAWNNLLLDGRAPTNDEIVIEARENWHPAKLNIPREKFVSAIRWLRDKNMVPKGLGKRVVPKSRKL